MRIRKRQRPKFSKRHTRWKTIKARFIDLVPLFYQNQAEKKAAKNRNVGMEGVESELIELKLKGKRKKKTTSFPGNRTINAIPLPIHPALDLLRFTRSHSG